MRARWLPLVLVSLTGCSLLYWPSSDEFAAPPDAASAEGSSPEAGEGSVAALDGAADGKTEGGGVGPLSCPPSALICDDFERDRVTGPFATSSGIATVSTTRAHSPTRSLSSIVRLGAKGASDVSTNLTAPTKVTFSFWFYAASPPPAAPDVIVRIGQVLWGDACDWDLAWSVFLSAGQGLAMSSDVYDIAVNGSCGPIVTAPRVLLTPAEVFVPVWHHVVVTMDVSSKTRRTTGMIDDMALPSDAVSSKRSTVPTSANVAVGIPCVQTTSGCYDWDNPGDYEILVDDVTLVPAP